MFLTFCFLLAFSCFSVSFASSPEPPQSPPNYVVDLAGIIDGDAEMRLNGYLRELEEKTAAQMVILTVLSLDGEDIEGFSIRTAEKWKLGQKGKDNGVLVIVSLNDKKYRFEIGYGLEGILPDSLAGSIGREYLVPYFRQGDYSGGLFSASLALIRTIAAHEGVEITGMPEIKARGHRKREIGILDAIIGAAFLIGMIVLFIKHPRLFLLLFLISHGGRRSSGWHGGGGFGGGGFGGFGGGGGGGFGGGGASGGW